MRSIYVADVGDALCMRLRTIFRDHIQIDCGGDTSLIALRAFRKLNRFGRSIVFILSSHSYIFLQYKKEQAV